MTEPELRASAGIAVLGGQVVVHGRNLHAECSNMTFIGYFFLCATGRTLPANETRVLERLWIGTGYPDARIWCNRIAGYLGSARVDPGLALSAAIAASDSVAYGFRAMRAAYAVQAALPEDAPAREVWLEAALSERRVLHGYGRPIHGRDERIPWALRALADAGLRAGPALKRAFWLHRRLQQEKGIQMNIAALWAAVAIDFGIVAAEYDAFMLLLFAPGYLAVYADQRSRPPFSFLRGHQTRNP